MMLMHRALRGGNPVAGDVTAPTLSSAVGTETGATTATVGATTNEDNGTLYVVVTTSATQPSIAQIKAGNDHTGSAAAFDDSQAISSTGAKTFSATGLTAETGYYAHLVHTDAAANDSNRLSSSLFTTEASGGTALFTDTYETGDLTHTEGGVSYGSSNFGGSNFVGVTSTRAYAGTYSLEFRYAAEGSWSEQRMNLPQASEYWFDYYIWIPANYEHRSSGSNYQGSNNKFLAVYADPYETPGFQVNLSTDDGTGDQSTLYIHYYDNGAEQTPLTDGGLFIETADYGTWVRITAQVAVPTSDAVNDGVLRVWKNGTQVFSRTNMQSFGNSGRNYIDEIYLLGYANTAFTEETTFHIDNLRIATTNIFGVS